MSPANAITRKVLPVVLGVLIGGGAVEYWHRTRLTAAVSASETSAAPDGGSDGALDALRADVARLKAIVPSQSHTMMDVGYQWTNLWFAAERRNWPLAKFYFDEARQHILWTIRIRPVRKGPDGSDVNLTPIFESIDTSAFKAVKDAIEQQNPQAFASAYSMTLEACYGCHKASGKPYLHPIIPTAPSQSLIDFKVAATPQ